MSARSSRWSGRRRFGVVLGGLVAVATAALAVDVLVIVPRRVDRALDQAERVVAAARTVRMIRTPPRQLDVPPIGRTVTSTREVHDGLGAFGATYLATSGGLLVYRADGGTDRGPARVLTPAEGLASADCTALATFDGQVVVGGGAGGLTLLTATTATRVRLAGLKASTAITDLAVEAGTLEIGTLGAGLLAWDGIAGHARVETHAGTPFRDVTALAVGPAGLAVGTLSAGLFVRRDSAFHAVRIPASLAGLRITAVAWDGDALLVGTPMALVRVAVNGAARTVYPDTFVSSILVGPGQRTYVGTFDGGVLVFDPGVRQPRLLLAGERITRVRMLDGVPAAFGLDGAWRLEGEGMTGPVPFVAGPPGLDGAQVTALAAHGAEMWVGTFDSGIDVLDSAGVPIAHRALGGDLPGRDVNAIVWRPRDDEVLVGTVHGVFTIDGAGAVRRQGREQGLIGEDVGGIAIAATGDRVAYATNRGLTVVGPGGAARSLYALQGLANNHCYTVAWGPGGRLYVGTLGGLSVVGPDLSVERSYVAGTHGLPVSWITALATGAADVYAGTYGGGVVGVGAGGSLENLGPAGVHVNPGALAVVGDRLYVGTLAHGLLVYDISKRSWSRLAAPLGSPSVTAIATFGGRLWIGTEHGLVVRSQGDLDAALQPLAPLPDPPPASRVGGAEK